MGAPKISTTGQDGAALHEVKKVPDSPIVLPITPDTPQLEGQLPPPPVYHIFTRTRKLELVCIVSLAAIFSPLSSNIYFPALGEVSRVSPKKDKHTFPSHSH